MGGLTVAGKGTLAVTIAAPGDNGVFRVNGNVALDGTLAVKSAAPLDLGVYRVANYTGTVTDNGMKVTVWPPTRPARCRLPRPGRSTWCCGSAAVPVSFWNGSSTTPGQAPLGGTGTWKADATANWANSNDNSNIAGRGAFAVFQGTAARRPW